MIVAVDNGNKQTKTAHSTFVSGLSVSTTKPGFGQDILYYNNNYYMLSAKRKGYKRDKTVDDDTFVLTLFGIGKELVANGVRASTQTTVPITLLVGLPPAHYGAQYKRFQNYFLNRGAIEFTLNGEAFRIRIDECYVFVQGFAAMISVYGQVKNTSDAVVLDMGGFTLDYLPVYSGRPDVSACDSLEMGVIRMYNSIIKRASSEWDMLLTEAQIDAVLKHQQSDLPGDIKTLIRNQAEAYVDQIVSQLREREIDLRTMRPVFVGGGAMLLEEVIRGNARIGKNAIVVDDLAANVRGYEILYRQMHPAG